MVRCSPDTNFEKPVRKPAYVENKTNLSIYYGMAMKPLKTHVLKIYSKLVLWGSDWIIMI